MVLPPSSVWFGAELQVLVRLSAERGVLVVISGQTEGGGGEVAVRRASLGGTACCHSTRPLQSGRSTHRLQRTHVHRQLGGPAGPAKQS